MFTLGLLAVSLTKTADAKLRNMQITGMKIISPRTKRLDGTWMKGPQFVS
jgi:hypothetical protein